MYNLSLRLFKGFKMFKQNPHPIFLSSLKNDYTITEREKKYGHITFNWISSQYSLIVSVSKNSIDIYDPINKQDSIFYFPEFYFKNNNLKSESIENNISGVSWSINRLLEEVKNSLEDHKIQAMQVLVYKMLQSYPNISEFRYYQESSHPGQKKHLIMVEDQNDQMYQIKCENINQFADNFYFIDSICLTHYLNLQKLSNHELLENFNKAEELNKILDIQPIIKLI